MFDDAVFKELEPNATTLRETLALIQDVAAGDPEIGALEGSLKWGQPSVATRPRSGTPIRLGALKSGEPALFVHCQTSLVKDWPGSALRFEGRRAVHLRDADAGELAGFVRAALRYHLK